MDNNSYFDQGSDIDIAFTHEERASEQVNNDKYTEKFM